MNQKKILILRLSAIGDTVHTLPLVSTIKNNFPNAEIGWVVEKKAAAFVKNNPLVDHTYILEKKNLNNYIKLINQIRKDDYDIAIDVQGLLKSAVIMLFSGAKRRIAFKGAREYSSMLANELIEAGNEFDPNVHIIDRNLCIASYLGCDTKSVDFTMPAAKTDVWQKFLTELEKQKPIITLAPATTWDTKHWKEAYWSELLNELSDKQVIFTGTEKDLPLINRIIESSKNKNATVLAGKTNLIELAEIFRLSKIVVTPDSGSAHIAVATKHPKVICLLGPTAENRNGAYTNDGSEHINLITNVNCRPCYKKKCLKNGNNIECINKIEPKVVLKNINKILNKANACSII